MELTEEQQQEYRKEFVRECRQKAWGAACHADWIMKGLDKVSAEYTRLKEEDTKLEGEINTLAHGVDYHTVDNRKKRKELQERRNAIARTMSALGQNMQEGQKACTALYQNMETNMALAAHAEKWEWSRAKEV